MGSLGTRLHRDCNVMGDAARISLHVPSTCAQYAILSLLIIHIIPSRQIYVGIDNTSLILSVAWLIISSDLWNDLPAAHNISHAVPVQNNDCQGCSHFTILKMGCKLPGFSCIVVCRRPHQYSKKAPSSLRSVILTCLLRCPGRGQF